MPFTERALDHVNRPRNQGPLPGGALGQIGTEGDGPFSAIWVELESDVIARAAYRTYGCPASIACCSQLVELVTGRQVERATLLEPSDLITVLGGLPEGKEECAARAVGAFRKAWEAAQAA